MAIASPHQLGAEAYKNGLGIQTNPYCGIRQYGFASEWAKGWLRMQEQDTKQQERESLDKHGS